MENLVYHYTDLKALLGILHQESVEVEGKKKNKSSLIFWGNRYDCMNDPQDYIFAQNVVMPKMEKALNRMHDLNEEVSERNSFFPYIVSFSENRDDEQMWKNYNAEVCLVIDSTYMSPWIKQGDKISGFWGKCIYATEEEIDDAFIVKWKASLQNIDNIYSMAQHACVFIKRKAFEQEKEWRLYMADEYLAHLRSNGDKYEHEIPQDVKVKQIRDKDIILYKEFKIDSRALKGIIVNDIDYTHYQKVKKHLELLLMSRGFYPEDILIEQTNIYPLNN